MPNGPSHGVHTVQYAAHAHFSSSSHTVKRLTTRVMANITVA